MDTFFNRYMFTIICCLFMYWSALVRPCELHKPAITGSRYFFENRTINVNCTVTLSRGYSTVLELVTPHGSVKERNDPRIKIQTNELNIEKGVLYKSLIIENAKREDAGTYVCSIKCGSTKTSAMDVTFLTPEETFVRLSPSDDSSLIQTNRNIMRLPIRFQAYPEVNVTVKRNNQILHVDGEKYDVVVTDKRIIFTIDPFTVFDSDNYTITVYNEYQSSELVFDIRKKVRLTASIDGIGDKAYNLDTLTNITCDVQGYPLPSVSWSFQPFCKEAECLRQDLKSTEEIQSIYQIKSITEMKAVTSGEITCTAYRPFNVVSQTRRFLVYEIENGFGIKNKMNFCFPENGNITLTCLASKFEFNNVTWSWDNFKNDTLHQVVLSENQHSLISELKIRQASVDDTGIYSCLAFKIYGGMEQDSVSVTVANNSPRRALNTC